jgi:tripartite-type tricarboxylate transporter receptor subunit TctC
MKGASRRAPAIALVFGRSALSRRALVCGRALLCSGTLACVLMLVAGGALVFSRALAQEYPARPVAVIVPFSAGSASDVIARILLERMAPSFGQRFVVDNRPAAGGTVGTAAAARAAPDGYTLLVGALGPLAVSKTLMPDVGYDPEKDFAPISMFASLPNVVVVSAKLPVKTLAEFADYARRNPRVPYGSVGTGSSQHLAGAYFEQLIGAQMMHVPYRVTAQLQADLVSGEVPASFQLVPNVISYVKTGQVRALAVASDRRLAALPEVPTAAEAGVRGFESAAWFALLAPRGTPPGVIARLHRGIVQAMADPAVQNRFVEFGAEPLATTPEELARRLSADIAKWRGIIKKGGIRLEP